MKQRFLPGLLAVLMALTLLVTGCDLTQLPTGDLPEGQSTTTTVGTPTNPTEGGLTLPGDNNDASGEDDKQPSKEDGDKPTSATDSKKSSTKKTNTTLRVKTTKTTKKTTKTTKKTAAPTFKPVEVDPDTVETAAPTAKPTSTKPINQALTPVKADQYTGYQYLLGLENGKALALAYSRLVAGADRMETHISLNDQENLITADELVLVYRCYINDYPQHFWVRNGYNYQYTEHAGTRYALTVTPAYDIEKSELADYQAKWNAAAKKILDKLNGSMSDYDKELAIHDAILNGCEYMEGEFAHVAYGALVVGEAVCEGYARAFQFLCNQAGIPCAMVEGSSKNENHAWNLVKIDGAWYHADITWDDPLTADPNEAKEIYHGYFNVTTDQIVLDHVIDHDGFYPVPLCTATKDNYHVRNKAVVSSFDMQDMTARLKKADKLRLYILGGEAAMDKFVKDFSDHFTAVMKAAGKSGGATMTSCGPELIITLIK